MPISRCWISRHSISSNFIHWIVFNGMNDVHWTSFICLHSSCFHHRWNRCHYLIFLLIRLISKSECPFIDFSITLSFQSACTNQWLICFKVDICWTYRKNTHKKAYRICLTDMLSRHNIQIVSKFFSILIKLHKLIHILAKVTFE